MLRTNGVVFYNNRMSEQLSVTVEQQEVRGVGGEDTESLEWLRTETGAEILQLQRQLTHYTDALITMERRLDTADDHVAQEIAKHVRALNYILGLYSPYR